MLFLKKKDMGQSHNRFGSVLIQVAVIVAVLLCARALLVNTQANLEARNIASGFGFLSLESGMPISDSLLPYTPADSYGYAFFMGIINTLYVSVIGIVLATLIGVIVGVARVSGNWLVAKLAEVYVEVLRNIPLLLILFFTYGVVLAALPGPKASLEPLSGFFLNNRGIYLPKPIFETAMYFVLTAFIAGVAGAFVYRYKAIRYQEETGQSRPVFLAGLALIIGLPVLVYFLSGSPLSFEFARLKGFNFKGGMVIRPEFTALMVGLVLYTAAFIGENVRSGIQSVDQGQLEAAKALGLPAGITMRRVILPQALRVIIPATTNDYASLVKNSSLAVAIGYPDMVSIGGTIIGQNDQAIEIIAMWMAVYLSINLLISLVMNRLNARVQLIGR